MTCPIRWEYAEASYTSPDHREQVLAGAGREGWELVAVVDRTLIFKRPAST